MTEHRKSKQLLGESSEDAPHDPVKLTSAFKTFSFVVPEIALGKPRMTRSDVWRKRPAVVRYRQFCDTVRECAGTIPDNVFGVYVASYIPMPTSWSAKKKERMYGTIMRQRPDGDNIIKGILDALFDEDSGVGIMTSFKVWCNDEQAQIHVHLFYS